MVRITLFLLTRPESLWLKCKLPLRYNLTNLRVGWDGLSKVLQLGSSHRAFNKAIASFGFAYLRPSEFVNEDSGIRYQPLGWNF